MKIPLHEICKYLTNTNMFILPYYLNTNDINTLFDLNLKNNKYYYLRVFKDEKEIYLTILFENNNVYLIEKEKDCEYDDYMYDKLIEYSVCYLGLEEQDVDDWKEIYSLFLKINNDLDKSSSNYIECIHRLKSKNTSLIEKLFDLRKIFKSLDVIEVENLYLKPENMILISNMNDNEKSCFLNILEEKLKAENIHTDICEELRQKELTIYLDDMFKNYIIFFKEDNKYYEMIFTNDKPFKI